MTLEEISNGLLNGFHDTHLEQLAVDYLESKVTIRFNLFIGLPSSDEAIKERYAKATLVVRGMQYCVIEKPEDNGNGVPAHFDSTVDDFETATRPEMLANLPELDAGAFAHSFFVFGWNCCIHVAAQSAELIFDDPADRIYNDETLKRLIAESSQL